MSAFSMHTKNTLIGEAERVVSRLGGSEGELALAMPLTCVQKLAHRISQTYRNVCLVCCMGNNFKVATDQLSLGNLITATSPDQVSAGLRQLI